MSDAPKTLIRPLRYERDPAAIYAGSFATVRREARLERFSPAMERVAIRLIHACGMVEVADRLAFSPGAAEAGAEALAERRADPLRLRDGGRGDHPPQPARGE